MPKLCSGENNIQNKQSQNTVCSSGQDSDDKRAVSIMQEHGSSVTCVA